MIGKDELRRKIERHYGESVEGESVRSILLDLKNEGSIVIYWGNIPEHVLNDIF